MSLELGQNVLKLLEKEKTPLLIFQGYNNESKLMEMLQPNKKTVGTPVVVYLQYAAPEQNFQEIRRLQERVSQTLGIHVNQKLVIVINTTEWLGHEQDRYWEIFRKFIRDMQQVQEWNFLFYVEGKKKTQVMELYSSLLQYLKVSLLVEKPLDKTAIVDSILNLDKQAMFEISAVEYLAEKIFKKPVLEKNLELLVEDLVDNCDEELVSLEFTKAHLAKAESLYRLLSKNKTKSEEKHKGGNRIGISL